MKHSDVCLPFSQHHVLRTAFSVPLRRKLFGRRSLVGAVSANHASPPLPSHPIWPDVHVWRLLGANRSKNHWVPSSVNMASGVRLPVLNLLRGVLAVGARALSHCRHMPEGNKPRRFVRIASLCWFRRTFMYNTILQCTHTIL